jgi:tetratricopeptide (TPR) repeat protein
MLKLPESIAISLVLIGHVGCATSRTDGPSAQLFDNMGSHHRAITTTSAEAQRYFDEGLTWTYAFNHDEAIRSFTRAAELDPGCAMAWWGVALCQGPNYNDPIMTDERSEAAWDALQNALARIDSSTPAERALIEALSHRYANPWPEDREHLEQAYADAMAQVWAAYPNDSDVGTLYAESMMVQNPWELYTCDRIPANDDTRTVVLVLEQVMATDPDNPGANHLYIHAVEPSAVPAQGLEAADRLCNLVPASGHLRHMPSHIYVQTGMWERSIEQNAMAMQADAQYRALSPQQGIQHGYMTHNSHMLAYSAMMIGREKEAMAAARAMWDNVPEEAMLEVGPFFDPWMCSVYDVQKRFGRWDDILAEPAPPAYLPTTTAVWRAHRAVAYAAKKDFVSAKREHEHFRAAMNALPEDPRWDTYDMAIKFLTVSDLFIAGEIALQKGDMEEAARLLEEAAVIEDTLGYGEPPLWLQPVRHTLGAVYLTSGQYADAERVYRNDLSKWPENGWSLYGLSRALEEQGRTEEAHLVRLDYDRVWARADEPTTTSCKCIPET